MEEGTLVSDTGASGPQQCVGRRIWGAVGGVQWGRWGLYLHALVWELGLGNGRGHCGLIRCWKSGITHASSNF